jgi:hypothetical protein
MPPHFEWDEEKRKTNIRKHGLDFRDVRQVFNTPMLVALDDREEYVKSGGLGWGCWPGAWWWSFSPSEAEIPLNYFDDEGDEI